MRFKNLYSRQAAATTVGAILVGCLASALWDLALKPGLFWAGGALLDIATFGLVSLRDQLYINIARGSYDRTSLLTFAILSSFFVSSIVLLPLTVRMAMRWAFDRTFDDVNLVAATRRTGRPETSLRKLQTYIRALIITLWALSGLYMGFFTLVFIRTTYVHEAVVFLDQSQRIIGAYTSERERLEIASKIATMKSKSDFDKVRARMTAVAEANGLNLPVFEEY